MKTSKLSLFVASFFCLGLLVTPWFFGGNIPSVRTIGLATVFLCLGACAIFPSFLGTPTKSGLAIKCLLFAGIAWSAFQLVPLGDSPITVYPAGTRARICELILVIGAFVVASHIFRNQYLIPWAFGLFALNGVLLTFFGLAQTISETDKLYWYFELHHGGQPFGPFVNGNNAGGYLLMCFAAANFFLAQRVFRSMHQNATRQDFENKQSLIKEILVGIGKGFARIEPQQLYIVAALATITAGIFASLSRGASVALVVSLIVGWGLLFRRNWAVAFMALAVLVAGVGLILWTQQDKVVVSNIESLSLSDIQNSNRNRLAHWNDAWNYSKEYLPFGSGLGTYSISYLPFQTTPFKRWYKYAENQYLECLAELGIPGLALLLIAIGMAACGCFSLLAKPDSTSRAVGLTGLICLVGQMVASAFDFGHFIPANMLLMATMMGIVFAQLNWSWSASNVVQQIIPKRRIWTARSMALILCALSAWACFEYSAVDARQACRRFYERFEPVRDRGDVLFYQNLAEHSVSIRPDDAEAHYQLALNHILQYRLAASDAMVSEVEKANQEFQSSDQDPVAVYQKSLLYVSENSRSVQDKINDNNPREEFPPIIQPAFEPIQASAPGLQQHEPNDSSVEDVELVELPLEPSELPEQESTNKPDPDASRADLLLDGLTFEDAWRSSTLMSLHLLARASENAGGDFLQQLIDSQPVREHLSQAWKELNLAEQNCDRLWFIHLGLAKLCLLMGEEEKEDAYIDAAIEKSINNPEVLYVAGLLKIQSGKFESAYKCMHQCLLQTREYELAIIHFCRNEIGIKDFFEKVLPAEPYFRLRIARKYFGSPEDLLIKKLLLSHTKTKLNEHELPESERNFVLGEIERHSENYPVSIVHYKKALELEKHRVDWRVQYSRSLIATEMFEQAIAELKYCELYHGDHHLVCQRLLQRAKRLRISSLKAPKP